MAVIVALQQHLGLLGNVTSGCQCTGNRDLSALKAVRSFDW